MEFELLGWPADGPTLDLDHERFAYAGKFVMSSTGKAVARQGDDVVAAVAFNADRTDDRTCWLRYVTVRRDQRGDGIGPRLLAFTRDAVVERGFDACKIAVNNPFAFEACYRAGFGFIGEETGLAELVLRWPPGTAEGGVSGGDPAAARGDADGAVEDREVEDGAVGDREVEDAAVGDSADTDRQVSYRAGMERFAARADPDGSEEVPFSAAEATFVAEALERGPPDRLERSAENGP